MAMPQILTKKTLKKQNGTTPSVDFPKRGERITYPRYTLRISAPVGVKRVEVAIDEEQFRPCRQAAGHWWFDWEGYENGSHQAVARLETAEGRIVSCDPHAFSVLLKA